MEHTPPARARRVVLFTYIVALAVFVLIYSLSNVETPIRRALLADLLATLVVFLAGILLNNSSVYDPYWSVFPPVLYITWAVDAGGLDLLSLILILLSGIWAVRLTWNWVSGWRGLSHEDWRYVEFREQFPRLYWAVSLTAIHLFPTLVVFLASVPVYFAVSSETVILPLAGLAVVVTLTSILIEATADRQLDRFKRGGGEGPCVVGLWRFSRHPNYLGELGFWFGLMLFGLAAGAPWWSVAGMVVMVTLFLGYSVPVMERKIEATRPSYRRIRERVPAVLPMPGRYLPQQDERIV